MIKRLLLTIIYTNGNEIKSLVNYVHMEDETIVFTEDKQVHTLFDPVRIPLKNVKTFDIKMVDCDGWNIIE